ncbi:MAG: cytochrome P450, partial [Paracoccaceae bacterium]
MTANLAQGFELSAPPPGFAQDPYPVYAALLAHAPLKRFADGSVMISRWEDLSRVYRDAAMFSSAKFAEFGPKYGIDAPLYRHHTTSLVFSDPPLHTRVRRILSGALTPRAIAAMEPGLIRLVDLLLDDLEGGGTVDLVEDFASRIPIEVIGNLFDMPHAERGPLRDWSLAILGALEPVLTQAQEAEGNAAVEAFSAYLADLVARRTKTPGDPTTDVLTRLIQSEDPLTTDELIQNCIFILNAGHETTTNLIGNALGALADHP